MKINKLLALVGLGMMTTGAMAQTDVTSLIANADLSSTDGWTENVSGQFRDYGNGLIGTYNVRISAATVDETHLATEYCFGFECRWSTNFASYTQTLTDLPAGVYTLSFDVENVNAQTTNATYNNLFYAQAGESQYADASTEWMSGKSSWTTHSIDFKVTNGTATISLGYGTGSNNFAANNTPALYVSHLKLTFTPAVIKDELKAAIDAATAADHLDLASEISVAQSVYDNEDATQDAVNEATQTLAAAQVAAQKAYELAANKAALEGSSFTNPSSDLLVNGSFNTANQGWTLSNMGYQQNGERPTRYIEKWQPNALTGSGSATQTIKNLPAGAYLLKGVIHTNKTEEAAGVTLAINESSVAASGSWKEYSILYNLQTDGDITVTFSYNNIASNWVAIDEFSLVYGGDYDSYIADEAIQGPRLELDALLSIASQIDLEVNVGNAVFQKKQANASNLATATTDALAVYNNEEATVSDLNNAISSLKAAMESFEILNAPADGQLFNLILTYGGWTYDQKAVTFIANGRNDGGLYNVQYKEVANKNLAQAFTFTKVEGNNYLLSQIDADGNVRYLTTGVPYGGNSGQIRTSTNVDDAAQFTITATDKEGVYNLFNIAANQYIGSQDAGFFTVNSHIDFQIIETTKPEITINTTAAGWGTVILPFAAALPEGVKAYSCAAVDGTTLTLAPADAIEANVPYIIEGAWNATLTGDAQGTALTYTAGLLTGVYADQDAVAGSYVLQNQAAGVGFYKVEETIPTVGANHAYLTYEAPAESSEIKAFVLGGTATGIAAVKDAALKGAVYNLAGQRVNGAQKGIYIVNGKKVIK